MRTNRLALLAMIALSPLTSEADLLGYTLSDGSTTYSWQIDSESTPCSYDDNQFNICDVVVTEVESNQIIEFYNAGAGGGFDAFYNSFFGPELYSGSLTAPTLLSGDYTLYACNDHNQPWYLEVKQIAHSVPEPGTLALLGLGLAGFGLTRRQRKTAAI